MAELSCRLRLQTFAACDIVCLVSGPGRWVLLTSFLWVRASDDPDSELKPFRVSIASPALPSIQPRDQGDESVFFFLLRILLFLFSLSLFSPHHRKSFLLRFFSLSSPFLFCSDDSSLSLMEFPVENCWFFSLKLHQPLILNYHQSRSLSELFLPRYVSLSLVSVLFVIFWSVR